YPFAVIAFLPGLYQAEQIDVRSGDKSAHIGYRNSFVQVEHPFSAEGLDEGGRALLLNAAQERVRRSDFPLCLVWGPAWCSYVRRDDSILYSFEPPTGGRLLPAPIIFDYQDTHPESDILPYDETAPGRGDAPNSGICTVAPHLRRKAKEFSVAASPIKQGSRLGVVLDYGHSDVGSCLERPLVQEISSFHEGLQLLAEGQERLLTGFIAEISKIRNGILNGPLVWDGSYQYIIAQVVTDFDGAVVPVAGFAMTCDPADPSDIGAFDWDQEWEEVFGGRSPGCEQT
ncbi:MAG: hypothetical protein ABIO69_01665, partial [Sphingomicrobium sp.]